MWRRCGCGYWWVWALVRVGGYHLGRVMEGVNGSVLVKLLVGAGGGEVAGQGSIRR